MGYSLFGSIGNNFKIAYRNLKKNKLYAGINILGLSVAIAASILLFSIINFELSFDQFHQNPENIYRVVRKTTNKSGQVGHTSGTSLPMADALRAEIPQFKQITATCGTIEPQITILGADQNNTTAVKQFLESDEGICVEPAFFDFFNFKFKYGTASELAAPNVVVLSEKYAIKYFDSAQNALGKYLKVNNLTTMKVVGIIENPQLNTDFPLNLIFSYQSKRSAPDRFGFGLFDDWGSTSSMDQIFVKVDERFMVEKGDALLKTFTARHWASKNEPDQKEHSLQPLADWHFNDKYSVYKDRIVSKTKLWATALVALLIIAMACINFINISTAVAGKRAKEVGVRKTLGSNNANLVFQFFTETILVVFFAVVLGLVIAYLGLPILQKAFDFPNGVAVFSLPYTWLFLIVIFIAISFLSGIYPALVLSSFSPLEAFRQKNKSRWGTGINLRKSLIVFQFSIAVMLLVGTTINYLQMDYIDKLDTGFTKEGIIIFDADVSYKDRNQSFANKLKQLPGVESISFNADEPSSENNWSSNFNYNNATEDAPFDVDMKLVDDNYFETYNLKLLVGRIYTPADSGKKILVNERLLSKLGVKNIETALGKKAKVSGQDKEIIGVVRDFHVSSVRDEIKPIAFMNIPKYFWRTAVRIKSTDIEAVKSQIASIQNEIYPEVVFNPQWYTDKINKFYTAENQLGLLYRTASLLAVLIAALGLFGLITFMAEERTKEIGIRKVMGASIFNITALLSKDFMKLVVVALAIGFPLAWYFMNEWLQNYVYRIGIEWWVFALVGFVSIAIALLAISYQSIKSAMMDPVKSLKTE